MASVSLFTCMQTLLHRNQPAVPSSPALRLKTSSNVNYKLWTSTHRLRFASAVVFAKPKAEEKLVRVLQSEIEAAEEGNALTEVAPEVSIHFEVVDTPGFCSVIFKRKYRNEEITVEALPTGGGSEEDVYEEEEEGDRRNDDGIQVSFIISVTKGDGPFLEFSCTANSDEVMIEEFALKEPLEDPYDRVLYEGPNFQDLDEKVQRGLYKFLEVRGITTDLANYLSEYMIQKESNEYIRWLKNLKAFVQKD
eukprot:TRINITY_DN3805_c0_g1_i1.p1 TRINITY_DN3805_c0_g1~~TRINITY_DN3805_c0_g1_i1.p1  ORF type:complete len:250 (-),score=28.67 TRINITY_DN3805_c0_g1_i1:244-993(-)